MTADEVRDVCPACGTRTLVVHGGKLRCTRCLEEWRQTQALAYTRAERLAGYREMGARLERERRADGVTAKGKGHKSARQRATEAALEELESKATGEACVYGGGRGKPFTVVDFDGFTVFETRNPQIAAVAFVAACLGKRTTANLDWRDAAKHAKHPGTLARCGSTGFSVKPSTSFGRCVADFYEEVKGD